MRNVLIVLLFLTNTVFAQSAFMRFSEEIAQVNDMDIDLNTLWLATDSGVVKATIQPETYQFYLSEEFIRIKKRGNDIWAASESNGFYKYDGNTWQHITRVNGLISDSINDFDIDQNGDVWLATDKGISRYNGTSFTNHTPFQFNDVLSIVCTNNGVYAGNSSFGEPVMHFTGATWSSLPLIPINGENRTLHLGVDSLQQVFMSGLNNLHILVNGVDWIQMLNASGVQLSNNGQAIIFKYNNNIFYPNLFQLLNPFELYSGGDITAIVPDTLPNSFFAALHNNGTTTLARFFNTSLQSYEELSPNELTAGFSADGSFFNNTANDLFPGLNIQGKKLVFTSGIFLSGWQGNAQARSTSVKTYTNDGVPQWVMGPASSNRNSYSFFEKYNRVWRVTKTQIDDHKTNYANASYQIPEVILNWPGNGNTQAGEERFIAPFVDLNWNGIYEPLQGDYPEIRGDEAIFMVYNTVDGYSPYGHQNLGLECHTMAYAYDSLNTPLHNTLFVHQQLISKQRAFDTLLYGHFQDFELGNPTDDVIAADSARNMIYVFNGDLIDEGFFGYGINPPAAGFVMLSQPLAGAMATNNAAANTDEEFSIYMLLRRTFIDGSPIRLDSTGGDGYLPGSSNPITNFQFNDRAGWLGVSPPLLQDKRFTAITAHTSITQGDKVCLDFAYIYAPTKSPGNILGPVDSLKNAVDYIRQFYQNQSFACLGEELSVDEETQDVQNRIVIYPNPANNVVTIDLPVDAQAVQLLTISGQSVQLVKDIPNGEFQISVASLPNGVYILKVSLGDGHVGLQKLVVSH
jgi:hypothetical protein